MDTGNMESDEVEIDSPTALNIDINWQEILPEPEIPVTAAQPQPVTQNDEVVIVSRKEAMLTAEYAEQCLNKFALNEP
jgi:hypothetical protein